jgi:hypothetical protein
MNSIDEIIELYRKDVDVTLIEESLCLIPEERVRRAEDFGQFLGEIRAVKANLHRLGSEQVEFILVGDLAATSLERLCAFRLRHQNSLCQPQFQPDNQLGDAEVLCDKAHGDRDAHGT